MGQAGQVPYPSSLGLGTCPSCPTATLIQKILERAPAHFLLNVVNEIFFGYNMSISYISRKEVFL